MPLGCLDGSPVCGGLKEGVLDFVILDHFLKLEFLMLSTFFFFITLGEVAKG